MLHKSFVFTSVGKKNQSEKHSTSKPNQFATIPPHTLVSCTSPVLRHRRQSWLCGLTEGLEIHETSSYTNRITYRTKNFTNAKAWSCWCCWRLVNWSQSLKIQHLAPKVLLSRSNAKDSLTILKGAPLAARLLIVGCTAMVFNALQINSCVFSEELVQMQKNPFGHKRSTLSDWHLQIANSASITSLAIHSGDIWVRACNVWLPRCPSYSMNAVVHIGKRRLSKPRDCDQILTSPRTKQRPAALPCEKCEWWGRREQVPVNFLKESFVDEETCGDRYRIEHAGRWLDQRVAFLADQPVCSDELDEQPSSFPIYH